MFTLLIAALDQLRQEGEANAEVVKRLVADAHGTQPPEPEPEDVDDESVDG